MGNPAMALRAEDLAEPPATEQQQGAKTEAPNAVIALSEEIRAAIDKANALTVSRLAELGQRVTDMATVVERKHAELLDNVVRFQEDCLGVTDLEKVMSEQLLAMVRKIQGAPKPTLRVAAASQRTGA